MDKLVWLIIFVILLSCSNERSDDKGIQVRGITENNEGDNMVGLLLDSLKLVTQPNGVLLTKSPTHRLTPIYKVNYRGKRKTPFVGTTSFHVNYWEYGENNENNWNHNYMPGFEAIYGYNLVNVSHFNKDTREEHLFFKMPVLVKTLYYPASSRDTLNNLPVDRDFYMVSVYDEDTNRDGYINTKDLRRFYHFNLDANKRSALIPKNYSVMSSEYDPENDFMYVFARIDMNENGQMEYEESVHVFWIDLKNPNNIGIQYGGKQ